MNRRGFTLVELLATLVILGVVLGITIVSVNGIFKDSKNKTEDVFVGTIKDAMEIYLSSSDVKDLDFSVECSNTLNKSFGNRKVYKAYTNFGEVINSDYRPISQSDLVNPANEDVSCRLGENISINIYRDEDFVYYYSVDKSNFGCLLGEGVINNLPEGFEC